VRFARGGRTDARGVLCWVRACIRVRSHRRPAPPPDSPPLVPESRITDADRRQRCLRPPSRLTKAVAHRFQSRRRAGYRTPLEPGGPRRAPVGFTKDDDLQRVVSIEPCVRQPCKPLGGLRQRCLRSGSVMRDSGTATGGESGGGAGQAMGTHADQAARQQKTAARISRPPRAEAH